LGGEVRVVWVKGCQILKWFTFIPYTPSAPAPSVRPNAINKLLIRQQVFALDLRGVRSGGQTPRPSNSNTAPLRLGSEDYAGAAGLKVLSKSNLGRKLLQLGARLIQMTDHIAKQWRPGFVDNASIYIKICALGAPAVFCSRQKHVPRFRNPLLLDSHSIHQCGCSKRYCFLFKFHICPQPRARVSYFETAIFGNHHDDCFI
jgi:hypothetical protein